MKLCGREGDDRRTAMIFYLEVVQEVLIFGSDTWVMTPCLEKALKGLPVITEDVRHGPQTPMVWYVAMSESTSPSIFLF